MSRSAAGEGRGKDFDAFFYDLLPGVIRLAQRMTGDRATAEDIAAESFARAFARWEKVASLPYREAWVMRVAANLAIDLTRRRRLPLAPAPVTPDPADQVALRLSLAEALRHLPKAQRDAIVLRYLADLSEEEIARAMGVRPGTVKSHLHRARQTLARRLGTDPEEISYGIAG
jgi:RNA polymerase sigma-70 factor (ECF subfamily)